MLKVKIRGMLAIGVTPLALVLRVAFLRTLRRLPKAARKPPAQIQRIFFSFPYHSVGDLILSLTLLDRVHDHWPGAEIDFAVGASMAPLVQAIPYIRHTFALPRAKSRGRWTAYLEIRNQTRLFQRQIAGKQYDLAIAPRWDSADSFFSAYLAYLTGAPVRCGYSGASDGGTAEVDRLLTIAAKGGANEHESLRYTRLLARCGFEPEDSVGEQESRHIVRALTTVAQTRGRRADRITIPVRGEYVVLSPGATNGRRMWPPERFAEVARSLHRQFGLTAIVIGSPGDAPLCEKLALSAGDAAVSMAGRTSSLQMLDLIADAALFVGNDSGPAHIAGALGIRTIVISPFPSSCAIDHPNSPRRFRPAGPRVKVLQPLEPLAPCFPMCRQDVPHCILGISTETVLAAAHDLIDRKTVMTPATSSPPQGGTEA